MAVLSSASSTMAEVMVDRLRNGASYVMREFMILLGQLLTLPIT
jgi:hypothetical protein